MRSKLGAALAGVSVVAAGAMLAGAAQAQTYYYNPPPAPYYVAPTYVAPSPGYVVNPPAYYDPDNPAALAGALIGTVIGQPTYTTGVPADRFGPDPNGMIARDGHRIKCKLRDTYDDYYGRYVTRRVCD